MPPRTLNSDDFVVSLAEERFVDALEDELGWLCDRLHTMGPNATRVTRSKAA